MNLYHEEMRIANQAILEAGEIAQGAFGGQLQVDHKPNQEGPVSEIDRACDALLRKRIGTAFPDDALLTEESADDGSWRTAHRVWIIDPIDGTQEYVTGVDQYAIMIGLCIDGKPTLGSVYAPAQDMLLHGVVGQGAKIVLHGDTAALRVPTGPIPDRWRIAVSRSHISEKDIQVCTALGLTSRKPLGSVGLKIAAIARGEVDLYLTTTNRIKLWDTCGPEAILVAAGGSLTDLFGQPLEYRTQVNHPHGLLGAPQDFMQHLAKITGSCATDFYKQPA